MDTFQFDCAFSFGSRRGAYPSLVLFQSQREGGEESALDGTDWDGDGVLHQGVSCRSSGSGLQAEDLVYYEEEGNDCGGD